MTGRVRLFVDRISGGKSEERGASNGFHIDVLRTRGQPDPILVSGRRNFNHAAWARILIPVRADGLNEFLTTNREQFRERHELKTFRAFLPDSFPDKVRTYYDRRPECWNAGWRRRARAVAWGALPQPAPQRSFGSAEITTARSRTCWMKLAYKIASRSVALGGKTRPYNIKSALGQAKYERLDDDSFVKFRIADSTIVVNRDHPFVAEHSRNKG